MKNGNRTGGARPMTVAPHGSWKSPITSDLIVSRTVGLSSPAVDGKDIYWLEARPSEGGRNVLVRLSSAGRRADLTPQPFNVRTRVHEYGGGAFAVDGGEVQFCNFADQRIYRVTPGAQPLAITPDLPIRYADGIFDRARKRTIWVTEDHSAGGEAVNSIGSVPASGGPPSVLVSGNDFYACPRMSPDGAQLAWLTWNHPNMPWDGCELWVGSFDGSGRLKGERKVAGGIKESIFQPEWSPAGQLHFVSDRSGWWNLYRLDGSKAVPLAARPAEFGVPYWVFGLRTYAFMEDGRIAAAYQERGGTRLGLVDTNGKLKPVKTAFSEIGGVRTSGRTVVVTAASETELASVVAIEVDTGAATVHARSGVVDLDKAFFSIPTPIEFPTAGRATAHAFYYEPRNPGYTAPPGELPPLIVMSHGGPTGATSPSLNLRKQFWTSRGFAVLDVNYRGSAGYGREYRHALDLQWGIADVEDCSNGAAHLAKTGRVDGDRMVITGGSAGGYTTLASLTFKKVFAAGASHYGVSDLEALATETHKFESRYLDGLIGPYPARKDTYDERSPIHHVAQLSRPVIFFQGLEDKVVPPNQAEMMVDALRKKSVPVAYITFEGEQHGFRKAENIKRSLDAELYFYGRILGFEPADSIEPVKIENMA